MPQLKDDAVKTKPHRLFDIGEDVRALEDLIEEAYEAGADDDETRDILDGWLDEVRDDLEAKLDGYGALMAERKATSEARRAEAKRLSELAKYDENFVGRMKERLCMFFETHGIKKLKTPRYVFTHRGNGGKAPIIYHIPEDQPQLYPEEYQTTIVVLNKEKLREHLEAGVLLDGIAQLGERGNSIMMR